MSLMYRQASVGHCIYTSFEQQGVELIEKAYRYIVICTIGSFDL